MTDLFAPKDILIHQADEEAVDSFVKWRKSIKKPLTDRAAKMIAKSLQSINQDGGDATEALDLAQEHGWQTIKPEWYWRIKNGQQSQRMGGKQASRSDATARAITIAAGATRASLEDPF